MAYLSMQALVVAWDGIVQPSDKLVSPEDRRLAKLLATLATLTIIAVILFNIPLMLSETSYLTATFPIVGPAVVLMGIAYAASRTRFFRRGALIAVIAISGASIFSGQINPAYRAVGPVTLGFSLLFAAIFFSVRETATIATANGVALALDLVLLPQQGSLTESMAIVLLVALMSATLIVWMRYRDQMERFRHADLLESHERFQHLADSVPVLIWMSGPDMLCTYFNQRWLEFTGRTLDQEMGNGWAAGVHPEDMDRCLSIYQSAFKERQTFSMDYRLRRADGFYRWIRDDGAPRISPDGIFLGYIGGCVDITEQKNAEAAIARSEERFRRLVETAPGAILLADKHGKIVLVNEWVEKMFGYKREELLGHPVELLLPEKLRGEHEHLRTGFFGDPATRPMGAGRDLNGRRNDGSLFPVEVGLSYTETQDGTLALAMLADITARKQAEGSLRDSREKLQTLFNLSPVGISLVTTGNTVLDVNPALQRILGISEQDLYAGTFRSRRYIRADGSQMPPEEFPTTRALSEQRVVKDVEIGIVNEEGRTIWASVSAAPTPDGMAVTVTADITERKLHEEVLRYQALVLETVSDAVTSLNFAGEILSWNQGAESIYGWRADEVVGEDITRLLQTEYLNGATRAAIGAQIVATGRWRGELLQTRKDGRRVHVEVATSLLIDSAGNPLGTVSVARDVTNERQLQDSLRRSEANLRAILDNAAASYVLMDSDKRIIMATRAAELVTHDTLSKQIEIGDPFTEFLSDWNRDDFEQNFETARKGGVATSERSFANDHGQTRAFEFRYFPATAPDGKVLGICLSSVDISERKRSEEQLKESERFATSTIDALSSALCVLDERGVVLKVNKGWRAFADANPPVIPNYGMGVNYLALCADVEGPEAEDAKKFADGLRMVLTQPDTDLFLMEYPCHSPSGEKRWYQARVTRFAGDGPMRVVVTHLDITARKLAELELAAHQANLEQLVAQRTSELQSANEQLVKLSTAKDQFVSNVSHELRTPITNLKLHQFLIKSHPDDFEHHLGVVERETERLNRIIEDLLQLSRLDQGHSSIEPEIVNLNALVHRYISDQAVITTSKNLKILFDKSACKPAVMADYGLLEQVLGILITNATNYTPSGGSMTISTSCLKNGHRRMAGFSVTDTGPGIPMHDLPHLFERFYRGQTGKQSGSPGTGLGLALAKQIVERHGGVITAANSPNAGEGARFEIWLPEAPN